MLCSRDKIKGSFLALKEFWVILKGERDVQIKKHINYSLNASQIETDTGC